MLPDDKTTSQIKIRCEQMPIKDNIICLLHYGSVKQKEDFSTRSDLDFHLVLKVVDEKALQDIKDVFGFCHKIDLSFHSIDEVLYKDKIIFQNGNQGLYFMHVLSSSETLIGENIYLQMISNLDQEKVKTSVIEKIRYYIWLLRRNYVFENDLNVHKKYFIRIMKDILILEKFIDYSNISTLNARQIVNLFLEKSQDRFSIEDTQLICTLLNLELVKKPEIESLLVFFAKEVNQIVWKNTKTV